MQGPFQCTVCGDPIAPRPTPGRPRLYCSGRCRTEAYRDRQARSIQPASTIPRPPQAPAPVIRAEILQATDALFEAEAAAPPAERLARLIIEARVLAHQASLLEPELAPQLAWRVLMLAERITFALDELFPIDQAGTNG